MSPERGEGGLEARLQALPSLSYANLHADWRRLWRSAAPAKLSRDLLELGVAWKLQEGALGGIDAKTRRALAKLRERIDDGRSPAPKRLAHLRPGARLIREWRGETHEVRVIEGGFEWRAARYSSLSSIAKAMTGSPRSGPLFFGLRKQPGGADGA